MEFSAKRTDLLRELQLFQGIIERKIASNPNFIFSVSTHERTKYQDYIALLDELKKAKATKISIANQ